MQVTNLTVRLSRKVQKTQFEPQEAEVSFSAVLSEDGSDNHIFVADSLMRDAKVVVLETGLGAKAGSANADKSPTKVTPTVAAAPAETPVVATTPTEPDPSDPTSTAAAPAARRGRPTKAEQEAKKAAEAAAAKPAATAEPDPSDPSSVAPAVAPVVPAAAAAPAPVVEEDEFAGLEDPAPAAASVIGTKELQDWVSAQISAKKLTTAQVKETYTKFNVTRTVELKEEDRGKAKAMLEGIISKK